MHAFVFTDKALARHAGRFVWLSIDTERDENTAFLEKFPISSWPTLLVLDPVRETAALKWLGSATVPQLVKLLDDGERAVRGDASGPEGELARADKLNGEGKRAEAAEVLRKLVAEAPADWSRRPRAVESLVMSLMEQDKLEECSRTAIQEIPRLPRGPSLLNVATIGLACAVQAPKDAAWRPQVVGTLEAAARDALGPPLIEVAADDRSGLYQVRVEARDAAGDSEGKKKLAGEWAAFLEAEATRASTPEARTVFDSHRLSAYLALGEPARAIPMLEASERALPEDYNPPARLAYVLRQLKRYDEALAANDRALARVYGPRKLRVFNERAEILLGKGERQAARRVLEEALAFARTLNPAQVSQRVVKSLEQKLKSIE